MEVKNQMNNETQWMSRCIDLAQNGFGKTYPNPLVGCVIVHDEKIIAEAWHQKAGEAHAEVLAIQKVKNKEILKKSTLYVSLEPCAHFGKTPPCSDLIIASKIPKVVIGSVDSFAKVNGLGIQKLKNAGIDVKTGVLQQECDELNKRFFTFHQKKRPYIILKWAQTKNGFMATESRKSKWITNSYSKQRVHLWRTQEQAILVGTKTAEFDNPQLNSRLWSGNQPIRLVLDRKLRLNSNFNLWNQSQQTFVFTEQIREAQSNLEFISIDFNQNIPEQIAYKLHELEIQSVIVEGGKQTLQSFLDADLWDEARVFTSDEIWEKGIQAPKIQAESIKSEYLKNDNLSIYQR